MNFTSESGQIVHINAGPVTLEGALEIPKGAKGIILFAHGSGSSRHSTRNNFVASVLRKAGLATLLTDLLTNEEDTDYEKRFDIDLLSERLESITGWIMERDETSKLRIGYFGASTGAAAAIQAAVSFQTSIGAIVSRGGRPDLAGPYLDKIKSPTLFIVGGKDEIVIELNRKAYGLIKAQKELVIVPGATHLFEEPGALEEVAKLSSHWFKRYLEPAEK